MPKVRAKVVPLISPAEAIAGRLKDGRKKLGLTQAQLAAKAHLARSSVINYEQGNAVPGSLELIKLANALQLPPNFILSGSDAFFPSHSPDHALAGENLHEIAAQIAICLVVVGRELAEPLSALLMMMVRQKLSKKQFAELTKAQQAIKDSIPEMEAGIEKVADAALPKISKRMRK